MKVDFYFTTGKQWILDLIHSVEKRTGFKARITENHNSVTWKPMLGEGYLFFMEIEEGLAIFKTDVLLRYEIRMVNEIVKSNDYFLLQFSVSLEQAYFFNEEGKKIHVGKDFSKAIYYSTCGIGGGLIYAKDKKMRTVVVIVSRNWILRKIRFLNLTIKGEIPDYHKNEAFQKAFNLDINCFNIAQQLLDNERNSSMRRLYVKGQVVKLLGHFYSNLNNGLSKDERQFLEEAEKIKEQVHMISDDLSVPWPELTAIAALCDMGKSKFVALFNKIFGCNYYTYYTQVRMQKAQLLIQSGLPVSEAGHSVGYTNMGHFSKVYKEYFGVAPSHEV